MEQPNSKLQEKWSDLELQAIIEFVLFQSDGSSWPAHKQEAFWNSASENVHTRGCNNIVSNGMHYFACVDFLCSIAQACRCKVTGWLAKKFKTPQLAEVHYHHCNSSSMINAACAGQAYHHSCRHTTDDVDESVLAHLFKALPINKQLEFLSKIFSEYMLVVFHVIIS